MGRPWGSDTGENVYEIWSPTRILARFLALLCAQRRGGRGAGENRNDGCGNSSAEDDDSIAGRSYGGNFVINFTGG